MPSEQELEQISNDLQDLAARIHNDAAEVDMLARRLQSSSGGGGGGGGAFDPLSDITWAHAYWAEDPDWTNPGDGNNVSSWRDAGTDPVNLAQATSGDQPSYSATPIGGQPALFFRGQDVEYLDATGLSAPSSAPWTMVTVVAVQLGEGSTGAYVSDNTTSGSYTRPLLAWFDDTDRWVGGDGVTNIEDTGYARARKDFVVVEVDGSGNVSLRINGTEVSTGTGASTTNGWSNLRVGQNRGTPGTSDVPFYLAFHAVKDGLLTAGEEADLETWAADHYGITIA